MDVNYSVFHAMHRICSTTYLFNQAITINTEMEHLSECIHQIADRCKCIDIDTIDFRCLIGQQC